MATTVSLSHTHIYYWSTSSAEQCVRGLLFILYVVTYHTKKAPHVDQPGFSKN